MAAGKPVRGSPAPQRRRTGLSSLGSGSTLLVVMLLWLPVITLACAGGNPVSGAVVANTSPETVVIRREVTGSVLITPAEGGPTVGFSSIEIVPRTVVLDSREQTNMSAQAFGPDQEALPDVDFVWIVADPRAGSITPEGLFRAGRKPAY